ncbi:MAG TPA: DUF1015 domain-containing protein [Terriglobales bacterium]|nr:DUF1015 domain-containing protein [Terriglobales bacterium]
MAHIEPFRAFRYNTDQVALSKVATQPYDKITPEMQERYYAASPYNLVRIILGKRLANDGPGENPYTRAAASLRQWRQQGILRQDPEPSIYRYVQRFHSPSSQRNSTEQFERHGFIALGKIEDYSAGVVFRHELTLAKPKADRLDLLRATRAHFGQIFMLYSDPEGDIDKSLAASSAPDIEMNDEYGVSHRVWKMSDSGIIDGVREKMQDKKLIIADGHHRYETALTYRNERRTENGGQAQASPLLPYELVMMTFVNMDSPGLLILPTHRVVHGLPDFSADQLRRGASEYFSVEEADAGISPVRATAMLREAGHTGTALLAVTRDRVFLMSRPKPAAFNFGNVSVRQQMLDVVQLHKCLLESVLGISEDAIRNQTSVTYIRDAAEAMSLARSGKANVAFLMNPVRIQQMRDVAFAGEVMPQKSTDFYPKLLSGLTVYALE